MLILKICENVKDEKAMQDDFIRYFDSLIKYLSKDSTNMAIGKYEQKGIA